MIAQGPAKTLAHEQSMVQRVIDLALKTPKMKLYGPKSAKARVGTVSFNIDGYTPQEAGSVLDESFNIAVRPGLHCLAVRPQSDRHFSRWRHSRLARPFQFRRRPGEVAGRLGATGRLSATGCQQ